MKKAASMLFVLGLGLMNSASASFFSGSRLFNANPLEQQRRLEVAAERSIIDDIINDVHPFEVQADAMTCPSFTCAASGGDCLNTGTDVKLCPSGEFYNFTSAGGTAHCNCAPISKFLPLGASCTAGDMASCGPVATCGVMAGGGAADYKCYGNKMIGDTCSNKLQCSGARLCTNNKCVANLMTGAYCYNATLGQSWGQCPLGQYCPMVYDADQVCTNWMAVGADCTSSGNACPPYTICGLLNNAEKTCDRVPIQTIADGGTPVGNLEMIGAASCVSMTMNTTSNKCVNYATELAKWKAAFPNPTSILCTTNSDCNLDGVTLATCMCTSNQTGAMPYCQLNLAPTVEEAGNIALYKAGGIIEMAAMTCENPIPSLSLAAADQSYCAYTYKDTYLTAMCPIIVATTGWFFSCYDTTYGICAGSLTSTGSATGGTTGTTGSITSTGINGASTTMSSSPIIVATVGAIASMIMMAVRL